MKRWRNPHVISFSRMVPDFISGRSTPRILLEQCLETIATRDKRVKAFVTLNVSAARRSADAATRRYKSGTPLSAVDGCPVAVKDIIATADMPTQMNSSIFKGWHSKYDAACVAALRQSGAVIIGKTATTEFAIGRSATTTNPFDSKRTPGGSSSGSGAAVGCGMVPAALGTQTQGSLLRPASYCGVVAFKPSVGAVRTGGVHPLSPTCDHVGVLAGTLEDAWRVAAQIPLTVGIESPGAPVLSAAGLGAPGSQKPRKLIRLYTRGWTEADSDTREAFNEVVAYLEQQGVEIASRDNNREIAGLEDELERGVDGALDIVAYEMRWPYEQYVARFKRRVGPRIHTLLDRAREMSPVDYENLLRNRRRIQEMVTQCAGSTDGLITLASSGPAGVGLSYTGSRTFLAYASWLGLPAFTLPLIQVNGLPVGVQLIGLHGTDAALCATAHWIERESG